MAEKPPWLHYETPLPAPARPAWRPGLHTLVSALTTLQVVWLVPSAFVSLYVTCETNGAPVPAFFVTLFVALPALGAIVAGTVLRRRGPMYAWTVLCLIACVGWVLFCAGDYVHFLVTRRPDDLYCP